MNDKAKMSMPMLPIDMIAMRVSDI